MTRPAVAIVKAAGNKSLEEWLKGCSTGEMMYLLAIAKGYNANEAYELTKSIGVKADVFLLKPEIQEKRDLLVANKWYAPVQVEEIWSDMLRKHYMEMVMVAGLKELGKEKASDRDYTLMKEATKCAIAQRGVAKKREEFPAEGYDEMILKRVRPAHEDRQVE